MRVTNNMMMTAITEGLSRNVQSLVSLSEKLSTGKKINRPSDDPVGMANIMDYQKTLTKTEQYITNIERGKLQIETMESVLNAIEENLQLAEDIALDQSSGGIETRDAAIEQIKGIVDQVMQLGNTKLGENYLFAGHQSHTVPFVRNLDGIDGTADDYSVQYNGDNGDLKIITGEGSHVKINAHGDEIFTGDGVADGVNVFDVLEDLLEGLENPDEAAGQIQIQAQVENLAKAETQINSVRTRNAGTYERLETTLNYWEDFQYRIEQSLSSTQAINTEQTTVELNNQETIYETTISLAAEVMNINLMNILS